MIVVGKHGPPLHICGGLISAMDDSTLDHAQQACLVFEDQTQGNETGSPVPHSDPLCNKV